MDDLNRFSATLLSAVIALSATPLELNAQTRASKDAVVKPNIIFILADDQSWNGTSVKMHPDVANSRSDFYRTPNLELLAAGGMRFSQAYSPGPMCSPTRASLQTGKSPAQLRMTNVGGRRGGRPTSSSQRLILPPYSSTLSTEEVTIGEVLKRNGYATAWFGKWHLGGDGPGAHGYDESDGPTGNADGKTEDPQNPKDIFGITRRGISFMQRSVDARQPFYLQLWHYAVHSPVQAKPETEKAYAEKTKGQVHQSTSYAGMTEDLDTGVGMVMQKVKELGISDHTYVIYMSDHGASRSMSPNTPLNRGKGTLWEGGLRVPLIVSGPEVKPGVFCNVPTVGWDMFPTFCDLAGIEGLPEGVEGISLRPMFETGGGDIDASKRQIAFHFPHYGQGEPQSTISNGKFKLIKLYDSGELRLYDLQRDIGEQNDLSEVYPEQVQQMHQSLLGYLKRVNAAIPSANPDFDPKLAEQSRRSGDGQGRRKGRRGPSQAEIAERQQAMVELEQTVERREFEAIGRLIANMKNAVDNARPRRARPGSEGKASPPRKRQHDIRKFAEAHRNRDYTRLGALIAAAKKRLERDAARAASRSRASRRESSNEASE